MIEKLLDLMRKNDTFNAEYSQALSALWRLHILEFLRERGRPRVISLGKDVQIMATQASYSSGYNDCLDDLTGFLEKFLAEPLNSKKLTPDYGGLDLAVERGDLDQKEAYELKANSNSTQ